LHTRRNLVLLALVAALLLAAGAGAWLCRQAGAERARAAELQRGYGDVLAVARSHADAVVNLRHDDPATFEAARADATGELGRDYLPTGDVVAPLRRDRTVLQGDVSWAGVVDVRDDEATALVATTGTLSSRDTDGEPVERRLRLRLEMTRVGGDWLVTAVELVA
jgi:Mce-associated membrane protein